MAVSIVTFADLGKRSNLKTSGIVPVISAFERQGQLRQVICRMGEDFSFSATTNALPRILHYGVKIFERIVPFQFSSRDIEEAIADFIASRKLKNSDIVLLHPEFAFPRTARMARASGAIVVGIATVAHPSFNRKLFEEERALFPAILYPPRVADRLTGRVDVVNSFDAIIALSELVKESYARAGFSEDRIFVAYPDIDGTRFAPGAKQDDVFRVLYIAHTSLMKGLHYLLEAWRAAALPNAELVIVGGYSAGTPPELKEWYRTAMEADPSIRWVGETKNPEVYYREASVLAFPSLTEGFGRVALEAMTSGIPVITTENAKGIVEDGVSGFVVPIRDVSALKEKMEYFYRNPEEVRRMGIAARAAATAKKPFGEKVFTLCQGIQASNGKKV